MSHVTTHRDNFETRMLWFFSVILPLLLTIAPTNLANTISLSVTIAIALLVIVMIAIVIFLPLLLVL